MIGWKCDVGYMPNGTIPTSLSDVVFTDRNVPVTFCNTIYQTGADVSFDNLSVDDVASKIDELTNFDSSAIYAIPYNLNGKDARSFIKKAIPSADLAYPNLWDYAESLNGGYVYPAIYIPGLKNSLIIRYSNAGVLWKVNTDGTLVRVSGNYEIPTYISTLLNPLEFRCYMISTLNYNNSNLSEENRFAFYSDIEAKFNLKSGSVRLVTFDVVGWTQYQTVKYLFSENPPPDFEIITPPNPYDPIGPSGPGDLPPGTFDDDSDPIPDSSLPTLSAANTGFTRIYNPTLSQVQALAQYLWTTPDIIETIWNHIKQFFENPMDAIIGFNLVPVPVPDGGTENFKLMYIDTGVSMTAAANQFVDRDCGTVEIKRYYGSALDQSPYTKVSCFLPYIGTVQLNTDEVMGTTLQVKYRVDICSGSCVAKIFIDGNCLYQYSGHCAINIPISSADFSSYVSAAINVAKLAIGAATAGAGGAAMAAAQVAGSEQQTNNVVNWQSQYGVGSAPNLPAPIGISQSPGGPSPDTQHSTTSASFAGLTPANISNTVGEIMNAKPHVEHSGSFSGNTGYLGVRRPFIIIERPNMCMPANYQVLNGFPAMITMELGTCKGFTRVQQVQLTGMSATNPEQAEILELLKSGVVL